MNRDDLNINKKLDDDKWAVGLRDRLKDYSEPLPSDLWESIQSDFLSDKSLNPDIPKIIPMWKRWQSVAAAAAVVIAVSSLSVWYWSREIVTPESVVSGITPDFSIPENTTVEVSTTENNTIVEVSIPENQIPETSVPKAAVSEILSEVPVSETSVPEIISVEPEPGVSSDEPEKEEMVSSEKKQDVMDMMKKDRETYKRNAYLAMADMSDRKYSSGRLQFGLSTGNIPYSATNNFEGLSRLSATRSVPQTNEVVISEAVGGASSYSQVLFNNRDKKPATDVKHSVPVTFGASVKWNLNDYWALESGLSYTMLSSELHSGASSYIEEKQKLHYVGIPLKVHRSVWGNEIFSVYASAGGMVEKCVSGKIESLYVTGNSERNSETNDLNVKPLQWSVMAGVGAQVNFNRFLSLYVEPGVAYYFDDNSEIMTIRKDKPLNFNLQIGLRFDLNK